MTHASIAATLFARVTVLYAGGRTEVVTIPEFTTSTDRLIERRMGGMFHDNGRIVDAVLHHAGVENPGRVFGLLNVERGGIQQAVLLSGPLQPEMNLTLGTFIRPGPQGGPGWLRWAPVFHNRAGNAAALDFPLGAVNTIRKVYGLAWYYHASGDVATRTFNVPTLHNIGGALPTGFTLTGNNGLFWSLGLTAPSLIADEEGFIGSLAGEGKDGRSVAVDNGTISIATTTSNPTPWPLIVLDTADEPNTILRFPAIGTGNANDTHSAYVLMEEWIVP